MRGVQYNLAEVCLTVKQMNANLANGLKRWVLQGFCQNFAQISLKAFAVQ
jgi:hypothetical protein